VCLLQVLPVNDTCVYNMWWDSYPYSSVSVYALHPQYLALRATLEDLPGVRMPADIAAAIEAARVSMCCVWKQSLLRWC
jgi:4-alpha-glucanotransferase